MRFPFAERVVVAALFAVVTASGCNKGIPSGQGPAPAENAVDAQGAMHPGPADRCPVCAMTVHDKKFPAAIALDDGRTFYFCGPGCMIRSRLDPKTHLGGTDASHIKSVVATDYFTGKPLDANKAYWIAGSDVTGPMGPMPVALSDEAAVKAFMERHGGKKTFRLGELTQEQWEAMRKKPAR